MARYPIRTYASKIRRPGESWASAMRRAWAAYNHPTKGYKAFKPTFKKQVWG